MDFCVLDTALNGTKKGFRRGRGSLGVEADENTFKREPPFQREPPLDVHQRVRIHLTPILYTIFKTRHKHCGHRATTKTGMM